MKICLYKYKTSKWDISSDSIITMIPILSILLVCFSYTLANDFCPEVKLSTNFDPKDYQGIWYEQFRLPLSYENGATDKCCIATFNNLNGNQFQFHSQQTTAENETSVFTSYIQYLAPAVYWEEFDVPPLTIVDLILEFKHNSHVVVYTCINGKPMVWVLTRDRLPHEKIINKALKAVEKNGIDSKALVRTQQHNCEVYGYLGDGKGQ